MIWLEQDRPSSPQELHWVVPPQAQAVPRQAGPRHSQYLRPLALALLPSVAESLRPKPGWRQHRCCLQGGRPLCRDASEQAPWQLAVGSGLLGRAARGRQDAHDVQDAWAGDVPGEDVPGVGALAMHVDALGALGEGVDGEEAGGGQGGVGIQVADERNLVGQKPEALGDMQEDAEAGPFQPGMADTLPVEGKLQTGRPALVPSVPWAGKSPACACHADDDGAEMHLRLPDGAAGPCCGPSPSHACPAACLWSSLSAWKRRSWSGIGSGMQPLLPEPALVACLPQELEPPELLGPLWELLEWRPQPRLHSMLKRS